MGPYQRAVELFPYVFHPSTVLGLGLVLLIHHEWAEQSADSSSLWRRYAAFVVAGVLAFVPTVTYFVVGRGGLSKALAGSSWQLDAMVAAGILLAAGVLWAAWHRFEWGQLVPEAAVIVAAVIVPYTLLSPFWDISGHVIIALAPLLYLTLVDRKFWPLLTIPVLMVPNRVAVNAHTWSQSIAGFVVAAVITIGLYYAMSRDRVRPATGSASS